MLKMKFKRNLVFALLIIAAIVLGSIVADLFGNVSGLSWLSYGISFGISSGNPLVLNLYVITLTFGLGVSINIAQIIFIVIALLTYKPIARGL